MAILKKTTVIDKHNKSEYERKINHYPPDKFRENLHSSKHWPG